MTAAVQERPSLSVVPEEPATEEPPELPSEIPSEVPADAESTANAGRVHGRAREAAASIGSWIAAVARPPDIVRDDLPSLQRVWRHVKWGDHVPEDTAARPLYALVWCVLCAAPVTFGYLVAWWHQRPARLLVGYALLWAVSKLPPVHAALGFGWHVFTTLARIAT